ncbi:MAG: NUDIX domain-containing protein [Candidatus Marinarcus sp.]|uniref:NUDIX domain-containing protein n=1 Tax=Candidatus Marinarcus sp. TaxID=3100987 RepID=UPI003B00EC46
MKNRITHFKTYPLENTKFVHPVKITYNQNGKDKAWEAVRSFDSVAVLLYHEEFDSFLLVKQFRPPVYLNDESQTFTYELCAGIVDKNASLEVIVQEEIDEECGYKVELNAISKITSFYTNVGVSGAKQHLYYAVINESMNIHTGGGIHDEEIELYFLKVQEAKSFIFDESKAKTPGLMFSFYWFFEHKRLS